MNKLRLVVTESCNRSCAGCCMKAPPVEPKPITMEELKTHPAKEVYITGGEPLLVSMFKLQSLCETLEGLNKKRILYSAYSFDLNYRWIEILAYLNGVTFTIHERSDLPFVLNLNEYIAGNVMNPLSLRLNVFNFSEQECRGLSLLLGKWSVRKREWLENCPLPEGEDFRKLVW